MSEEAWLAQFDPMLMGLADRPRWLVGFSGGLDSTVLLHTLLRWLAVREPGKRPQLLAVHVDHGLQNDSPRWRLHCERVCERLGIPCHSAVIEVEAAAARGPEAAARKARYQLFSSLQNTGDVLFLAHHLDDQVETVLLRLFRSGGVRGLAAMRGCSSHAGKLRVRPLLDIQRAALLHYARQAELAWVEDPSNRDLRFSRNFIRHRLLPLLSEHWPGCRRQLARLSAAARDSADLLAEVASRDLAVARRRDRWGHSLQIVALSGMSIPRLKNLLTYWLHGFGVPTLRARQWPTLLDKIIFSDADHWPRVELEGGALRRFRQQLYWVPAHCELQSVVASGWDLGSPLNLGGGSKLIARQVQGAGLAAGACRVGFRQGGERLVHAGGSSPLKKWLQAAAVPPWWRQRIPLLVRDGQLVAVADLYISDAALRSPGTPRYRLHWQLDGGNWIEPES